MIKRSFTAIRRAINTLTAADGLLTMPAVNCSDRLGPRYVIETHCACSVAAAILSTISLAVCTVVTVIVVRQALRLSRERAERRQQSARWQRARPLLPPLPPLPFAVPDRPPTSSPSFQRHDSTVDADYSHVYENTFGIPHVESSP